MSGSRLTSQERAQIQVLFGQGLRFAQIAAVIGRDRSTVWREVRRNRTAGRRGGSEGSLHPWGRRPGYVPGQGYPFSWGPAYGWRYSHVAAQRHADQRARRPRTGKCQRRLNPDHRVPFES
jgi:transposase, IS30 family